MTQRIENMERATRICKLHDEYTDHHDERGTMTDHDSFVADVLADLRHYCDMYGLDFDDRNRLGAVYYEDELNGEDDEVQA
jgi:hypothetical protein